MCRIYVNVFSTGLLIRIFGQLHRPLNRTPANRSTRRGEEQASIIERGTFRIRRICSALTARELGGKSPPVRYARGKDPLLGSS